MPRRLDRVISRQGEEVGATHRIAGLLRSARLVDRLVVASANPRWERSTVLRNVTREEVNNGERFAPFVARHRAHGPSGARALDSDEGRHGREKTRGVGVVDGLGHRRLERTGLGIYGATLFATNDGSV